MNQIQKEKKEKKKSNRNPPKMITKISRIIPCYYLPQLGRSKSNSAVPNGPPKGRLVGCCIAASSVDHVNFDQGNQRPPIDRHLQTKLVVEG